MLITVNLLKPFSDAVGKKIVRLQFETATVQSVLEKLSDDHSEFRDKAFEENGKLNEYISLFVNDKPLSVLKGIETELKDGDELLIFFPISGG
jgi:MoaD family protein